MTKRERVAAAERERGERRAKAAEYLVKALGVREVRAAWPSLDGEPEERLAMAAGIMEQMALDLLAGNA